jgi:hypothetical protein
VLTRPFRTVLIPAVIVAGLAALPSEALAQRRGPARSRVVVVSTYARPYGFYNFYDPWYSPWYGYGPYAQWGPYGPGPYGYYGRPDVLTSSVRLEVTPRAAEVFVDGYLMGNVDDFDGVFQRLRLRPGDHELVLYLDGYRTVSQRLDLSRGADQKVRYTMVPLAAGETTGPRPVAPPEPPSGDRRDPDDDPRIPSGPPQRAPRGVQDLPRTPAPASTDARFGSVSIRVQPGDADITIDGERWTGPAGQDRLVVQLAEGRHRVDVQKDGFEKYSGEITVRRGETVTLNISLLRAR